MGEAKQYSPSQKKGPETNKPKKRSMYVMIAEEQNVCDNGGDIIEVVEELGIMMVVVVQMCACARIESFVVLSLKNHEIAVGK